MGYISVRGIQLYVEEVGSGPHLVIAHGMFGSVAGAVRNGVAATDIAARGFHVVQYDARGHGRSASTLRGADYCWDALAEEMLGVMDALGLERASVLGTSMGAGAALLVALRAPTRIERLVLRTPPAMGADMQSVRWRLGALKTLYLLLGPRLTAAVLGALGQPGMAQLLREQRPGVVAPAIEGLVFGQQQLPEQGFTQISCPALILTHPGDREHPLRSGQILSQMRRATLHVAPSCGYWRTQPEVLTTLVTSFLGGEPSSGLSSV